MPKPWSAVEQNPEYQALPPDQREKARQQYFQDVVAPRVPAGKLEVAREQFDSDTRQKPQPDPRVAAVKPGASSRLGALATGAGAGFGKTVLAGEELLGRGLQAVGAKGAGKAVLADATLGLDKLQPYTAEAMAKHPYFEGAGELLGGSVGPAGITGRLMGTYVAAKPVVTAALSGALSGLLTPAHEKAMSDLDSSLMGFAKKKVEQIASGMAGGMVAGGAAKLIGGAATAATRTAGDAARKLLMDAGVKLTPGQMAGATASNLEEKATSVPITGLAISAARREAFKTFNLAAVNQALKPIGQTLPKQAQAGHQAIEAAGTILGDAYGKVLPSMNLRLDHAFDQDMSDLIRKAHSGVMPPDQERQFVKIVRNYMVPRFAPGKLMTGTALKSVESELTRLSNSYRSSESAGERELGMALGEVRQVFRENLERQNPQYAPVLQQINRAYAMFKPLQKAAAAATADGVFTPLGLLGKIRANTPGRDKGAFAAGNALMQPFAQAAHEVIGNKVPDSGTAGRVALMHLIGPLVAGQASVGIGRTAAAGAGLGAAGLAYRAAGPAARAAARNPQARQALARVVGAGAPVAGQAAVQQEQ